MSEQKKLNVCDTCICASIGAKGKICTCECHILERLRENDIRSENRTRFGSIKNA